VFFPSSRTRKGGNTVENRPADTPPTGKPWSAASNGTDRPVLEQAKEQSQQVLQQTQRKAGQVADQVRTQVVAQLESQKERAAGGLTGVAEALRQTGQHLREQDQQAISAYAEQAAEAVERFSGSMSRYSVGELFGEVESFARQQPALFLGSAFVLGVLAARFLKSSGPSDGGAVHPGGLPSPGSRPQSSMANAPPALSGADWSTTPVGTPAGGPDSPGPAAGKSPQARPGYGS
jgi:hypothetical protein